MEMTPAQKEKVLRKYGKCVAPYTSKRTPGEYVAVCPGCGKDISTRSDDLSGIELSVTKRGTATFWHNRCELKKVWNGRIK